MRREIGPKQKVARIGYSIHMDHLGVLRDKIGRLREEIADIQELNRQFRQEGLKGTAAQVVHGQRRERLQAIQHELVQVADLGRRVHSDRKSTRLKSSHLG